MNSDDTNLADPAPEIPSTPRSPVVRRVGLLFLMAFLLIGTTNPTMASSVTRILVKAVSGDVQFRAEAEAPWQEVEAGQVLEPRSEVQTLDESRVTLQMGDGNEVRIAPNSYLRINAETRPQAGNFDFQLMIGKAWAKFRRNVYSARQLIIRTAQAQVDIQGTSYQISADQSQTDLLVFSGDVKVAPAGSRTTTDPNGQNFQAPTEIAPPDEVTLNEWHVIVSAFYRVTIESGEKPVPAPFTLEQVEDDWVRWNRSQDRALD